MLVYNKCGMFTGEADVVKQHVERLIQTGLKPENIAIIAPYNLQVIDHCIHAINSALKIGIKL